MSSANTFIHLAQKATEEADKTINFQTLYSKSICISVLTRLDLIHNSLCNQRETGDPGKKSSLIGTQVGIIVIPKPSTSR